MRAITYTAKQSLFEGIEISLMNSKLSMHYPEQKPIGRSEPVTSPKIENQASKTNGVIRQPAVIPESELLKAIGVFQTEHPKPYYYGASTIPWEYSTGNKG